MKKNIVSLFIFFVLVLLSETKVFSESMCLQNNGHCSLLTISIQANNKKKFMPLTHSANKKQNFSHKPLHLFINQIDLGITPSSIDKELNNTFNETKKPASSLYEFNFMNKKSDVNDMVFQLLPFFNAKSQDDSPNPSSKKNMITLFQINFF